MISATQVANLEKVVEEFGVVFKNKGLSLPSLSAETVLDGSLGLESLDFAELVMRLELKDRRAGFPTRFLDAPSDEGVELKVEDGELHVAIVNISSLQKIGPQSTQPSKAVQIISIEGGFFQAPAQALVLP
jgi:hypothetical protein